MSKPVSPYRSLPFEHRLAVVTHFIKSSPQGRELYIQRMASRPGGFRVVTLRSWPPDFPSDISVQRRVPYESRADSVMYRQVLAELARARGWAVHLYDATDVEDQAVNVLGERADEVLRGPRTELGPPWTADHRMALAATIMAG